MERQLSKEVANKKSTQIVHTVGKIIWGWFSKKTKKNYFFRMILKGKKYYIFRIYQKIISDRKECFYESTYNRSVIRYRKRYSKSFR